jgi:hypothetical protein
MLFVIKSPDVGQWKDGILQSGEQVSLLVAGNISRA